MFRYANKVLGCVFITFGSYEWNKRRTKLGIIGLSKSEMDEVKMNGLYLYVTYNTLAINKNAKKVHHHAHNNVI
jgi:hypothetical protein